MCFRIELTAIDADRNCRRRYRVDAGQDLFGDWLVTITFGRLGTPGRTIVHVVDDECHARRLVMACLRIAGQLSDELGLAFAETRPGDRVEGTLGRMVEMTSGRYALVQKSREFTLVPWRPVLERQIGKPVAGIVRSDGTSWAFGRQRSGPSIS